MLTAGEILRCADFIHRYIVGRSELELERIAAPMKPLFGAVKDMHRVIHHVCGGDSLSAAVPPLGVSDVFKRMITVLRAVRANVADTSSNRPNPKLFRHLHTVNVEMAESATKSVKMANPIVHLIQALQVPKPISQLRMSSKGSQQPLATLLAQQHKVGM